MELKRAKHYEVGRLLDFPSVFVDVDNPAGFFPLLSRRIRVTYALVRTSRFGRLARIGSIVVCGDAFE